MQDPHLSQRVLLESILQSVRDAVVITDAELNVVSWNHAAEALTGWTEAEAIGRHVDDLLQFQDRNAREDNHGSSDVRFVLNPADAALRDGQRVRTQGQPLLVGKSGHRVAVEISATPLQVAGGAITGCVLTFYDAGEALHLADRIAYQTQHDPLTGLPNRLLLVDRLEQAAKVSDRHTNQLAVMFINLDATSLESTNPEATSLDLSHATRNFGEFREAVGAALADDLLKEVAYRLTVALRESDTVCRMGANEFVLLLPGIKSLEDLEALAVKLLEEIARPYLIRGEGVLAASSIGISVYPRDASDVGTLMRLADGAMAQARLLGANRYRFHQTEDERSAADSHISFSPSFLNLDLGE